MIARRARRHERPDLLQARVVAGDLQDDAGAVEDRVVRAADRGQFVRGDRRQRRDAVPGDHLVHVELQLVQLVQCRLDGTGHHLRRAREARRRRDQERERLRGLRQLRPSDREPTPVRAPGLPARRRLEKNQRESWSR